MRATWLGHATVLLGVDGVTLLTDPVLTPRVGLLRNEAEPASAVFGRQIDAVLVSHEHYDHLHLRSLRRFDRSVPVVVPQGLGIWLVRRGFTDVHEVTRGDRIEFGPVTVEATQAEHGDAGTPGRPRTERLGFLVHGERQRTYFAGDTDLFEAMGDLGGGLDLALLPVSGWGREPSVGHLTPARAAEALTLLRPRVAVPIHWGTLRPIGSPTRPTPERERPARSFERQAQRLTPDVEVRVLQPGETTELD